VTIGWLARTDGSGRRVLAPRTCSGLWRCVPTI